jgi:hypothetical protein
MKRVIIYLTVIGVIFLQTALMYNKEGIELLERTFIISLVSLFIFELGISYVKSRKIKERDKIIELEVKESIKSINSLSLVRKTRDYYMDNNEELTLSNENYKSRIDTMIAHDNAKINLGDAVTRGKSTKAQFVYAMRLVDVYNEYQLVKGGKWFGNEEIVKLETPRQLEKVSVDKKVFKQPNIE